MPFDDLHSDPKGAVIETPPCEPPKQPENESFGVDMIPIAERDPLTPTGAAPGRDSCCKLLRMPFGKC